SRPRLPLSLLGVPTQTREMSPSLCTRGVACKRPASTPRRINCSKSGSIIGLFPELMRETLSSCKSTPVTEWPISAKHAAVTQPTYPIPKTVTFIKDLSLQVYSWFRHVPHDTRTKLGHFSRRRVP